MSDIYDKYETVIGLEVHVQLSTASKAFCSDDARYGGDPNTHISTISLGHPGTLPMLNKKQVEYAVRLGLALGSEINQTNNFDRKNYFYADLPKGYQITQDLRPVCIGGHLQIKTEAGEKAIRIHHIHMEEDAGKSIHDMAPGASWIDLNRAGVPLLEIVTEPDMRSGAEVDAFMTGMRQLVRYLEVSDGNMQEGSMRCDCNVSVRLKGATSYGERCEIKNLNSMRYARQAIKYEVKRQIDLLESGGKVEQQTLNFDPVTGVTAPLRSKEDAHDYRYFPEPDLPPVIVTDEALAEIRDSLPALPWELACVFQEELGLSAYDTQILTEEKATALYFQALTQHTKNYKAAANLVINKILPFCQENNLAISAYPVSYAGLASFIQLIEQAKVSNTIAYQKLLPALQENPEQEPLALAQSLNLLQTADEDFLNQLVAEVIAAFPDKVGAYRKGKKGLLGFFMGEVMKRSKGKAEPKSTNALLRKMLEQ